MTITPINVGTRIDPEFTSIDFASYDASINTRTYYR